MKRVINILVTTLCAAVLFSCTHEYSFKTNAYVLMDETSFSVKEDAGLVLVPVSAYNSEALTGTVYFKVIDGTAVQGTDFTVEPADGVLHFDGNGTEYIKINVIEHAGVLTGNLKFSIELSAVNGEIANFGGITAASFEIKDNDVVVDWDYVAGNWIAQDYDGGSPDGGTYKVTISKKSETTLALTNLYGGANDLAGTIEFDKEANTATITLDPNQLVWTSSSYGAMYLLGYNFEQGGWYTNTPAVAIVTSGGISVQKYTFLMSGDYEGYIWTSAGLTTEMTKNN